MELGHAPLRQLLPCVGIAFVMATRAPTAHASTPVGRTSTNAADTERSAPPCFPASVPVWAGRPPGDARYLRGWAFIDPRTRFEGDGCQVRGWAPADPCGRVVSVYVANCPDGTFTFTRTESDCQHVLGCRDRHQATGTDQPPGAGGSMFGTQDGSR